LSLEKTTANWCQIREGEPTAETAQFCQKEGSTARECQAAWSARRRRQSERIKNTTAFWRRQAQGQRKEAAKMPKKDAAAIPQTDDVVSTARMPTAIATVAQIAGQIQGDLAALQQLAGGPSRKPTTTLDHQCALLRGSYRRVPGLDYPYSRLVSKPRFAPTIAVGPAMRMAIRGGYRLQGLNEGYVC
jgi:hypothetical protein